MIETFKFLRGLFILCMAVFAVIAAMFMVMFINEVDGSAIGVLVASGGIGCASAGRNIINDNLLPRISENQDKE